jgi:polyketide cyclase/dehydrase/lipid transport protein
MKVIVKLFAGLVGLWLILCLIGLFLPGHYRVVRTTTIAAPPAAIYPHVGDLRAWRDWGVWFARDPAMKIAYSPATTEVGAWSQWTSKSQGDGKMTITASSAPLDFEYRMDFTDMGLVAHGTMVLTPAADGTTAVAMGMEGELGRSPINRWFGLFMGKLIAPDFDAGLANLKRISEAPAR